MTIASSTLAVYAGTAVTAQVSFFTPPTNTPADPTTVTMKYSVSGGAATTWVYLGAGMITRIDVGIYSAELDTTGAPGVWCVEWIGTGACAVVQPAVFTVTPKPF